MFHPGQLFEADIPEDRARIGGVPATQEQRGGDAGHEGHAGIFRADEEGKPHAAIFRKESSHEFAFCLRQIEGHTIGLGHGRNDEDDKGEDLGMDRKESVGACSPDEPMPEAACLGFCDLHEAQRPSQQQHADDGQPDV